jgi:DNA-binding transcriptional LysR family regulator
MPATVSLGAGMLADTRKAGSPQDYGIRDWDDVRLIMALGRFGNFQSAARFLDTDQTTVSRRYRRLEETLGAKLFERQGNRLTTTAAGEAVIQRALAMETITKEINCTLSAQDARATGIVKVAVTEGVGHAWLIPKIRQFCARHDDIDVELIPSHGEYDLLLKEVDVAIGYARPDQLRLVSRRVGDLRFGVFAAKSYLEHHLPVHDAAQLRGHDMIDYFANVGVPSASAWMEAVRPANRVRLRTSSAVMAIAAIGDGVGIGLAPIFYENTHPEFIRVPCSIPMSSEVWLVSHEETNAIRRIRLLIDFITAAFERDRATWFSNSPA